MAKTTAIVVALLVLTSGMFLWNGVDHAVAAYDLGRSGVADVFAPDQARSTPPGPLQGTPALAVPLEGDGQPGWGVGIVQVWAGLRTPAGDIPEAGVCFETGSARACTNWSGWGEMYLSAGINGSRTYDLGLIKPADLGTSYLCRIQRQKEGREEELQFGPWEPVHTKIAVSGGMGARFTCVRLPAEVP